MTDFEEFARLFRNRTMARMEEFEKNLEKAQTEIEKAARQQAVTQQKVEKPRQVKSDRQVKSETRVQSVLRRNTPY